MHPKSESSATPTLLFLGLASLVLALLGWLLVRPAGTRLADDTYMRVLAVTSGPNHHFSVGERFSRRPFIWLPTRLLNRLGWRSHGVDVWVGDDLSTMVWFVCYDPSVGRLKAQTFNRVELVASDQTTVLAVAAQAPLQISGRQTGLLYFPGLTNLPAGAHLRFYRGHPLRLLGTAAPK